MDKETLKMFSEMLDSKLEVIENRLNGIDNRLDKSTMLLEDLSGKIETMAEVQKLHMEQNENTHNDIVKSFNEKIEVIELAVKNTSMDVKEIKNSLINVELITSSNWNEIVKLKAAR